MDRSAAAPSGHARDRSRVECLRRDVESLARQHPRDPARIGRYVRQLDALDLLGPRGLQVVYDHLATLVGRRFARQAFGLEPVPTTPTLRIVRSVDAAA